MAPSARLRLAGPFLALGLAASNLLAQDDAAARRAAIQAFYPVMAQAAAEGRLDQALALCQKAIEWEPGEAVHRYNLACIHAKAGRSDAAFAALEEAVARGFAEAAATRTDPDLVSLRADPRFEALVARMGGDAPPAPPAGPKAAPLVPPPGQTGAPHPPLAPAPPPVPPAGPDAAPAAAGFQGGLPVGPYFMTRSSSFSHSLEKDAWYFAPDGRVYCNLKTGFGPEDLAAHPGRKGNARLEGADLVVAWDGGETTRSPVERDQSATFMWDMGAFTPVAAFGAMAEAVGTWEGGESMTWDQGRASVAKSIALRPDGTYVSSTAASLGASGQGSTASAGATGGEAGRWLLDGWTMHLFPEGGEARRWIAFPFDDTDTPVEPDRMFLGGILYKRR